MIIHIFIYMKKICSKCSEEKMIDEFYKRKSNKDGHHGVCKVCYDNRIKENIEKNPESRKNSIKKYNDKVIEKHKEYYQKNKEKIKARSSKRYIEKVKPNITEDDRIKHRLRVKKYRDENPDKVKTQYINNKENRRLWYNNKRLTDPTFRLSTNIRSLIRICIKKRGYTKKSRTFEILGCSFEEFKLYLESKFEPWMNWDNYGLYNGELNYGWDIDHIIPVIAAMDEEGVINLNHYTNLQPLCSKINRDIKRANY